MGLENVYREMMNINLTDDNEEKSAASRAFFDKLNNMRLPEYFNWAEEVFEGIHVIERGSQPALIWVNIDTGEERLYRYEELAAFGNKALNYLRRHQVDKGDSVYMMLPSVPETWFFNYACVKGGLVGVPTATTMTVRELDYRFGAYAPQVILADEASAELIDQALEEMGAKPKVKIVLGKKEGWSSYAEIEKEDSEADAARTKVDDFILCFFTSGTTGLAKRVVHTAISYPLGHLATSNVIGIRPGDIHNNLSAPGWAKWAWSCFFAPLNVGATSTGFYYAAALDGEKYLAAVSKYKVNIFCSPPTAWRMFILKDLSQFNFAALRESVSAGEPLNPEIIQTWQKHTNTEIRDFYGQTESTAMIGNPPWYKGKIVAGSFGLPTFMYDVVLVSDDGVEITSPDEVGHIVVKLDSRRPIGLFAEYMGDAEKMKEVFIGDYYYTGDRASFDEKGYWWFVGRADDVIKSSDYRVGPFEVESALIEHEAVAETAVVGSPDPKRWQLVKAFVILKPGMEPSRELALDLFEHSISVLAKFKIPRIIEFVPEVPKTLSGKIRRIELREIEQNRRESDEKVRHEYFYHEFRELRSSRLANH
jgi:acyl-coenzyme A synthetase/AMP-(fatty) acid ligase